MNVQPRYRSSLVLALLIGFGAVIGIFRLYQNVLSKPIFPIDRGTLTITRVDRLENSEV
ncbi:MAG: hypothetical protein KME10_02325 [Plectolyngbya sp. WJT66-NPBG17]|nr:hypothetical protein [Plectolyngbya sp. WJT66-NPBG17]MBW4524017.1 hypothetical protein [Phormidium tanganyikae FI6-MK23]